METATPNIAELAITPKHKSSPSLPKNTIIGALLVVSVGSSWDWPKARIPPSANVNVSRVFFIRYFNSLISMIWVSSVAAGRSRYSSFSETLKNATFSGWRCSSMFPVSTIEFLL